MGKSKSALPDLAMAIQLKPDFLAVSSPDRLKFVQLFLSMFQQVLSAALCFPYPFYTIILSSYFQARLQRGNILLKQGSTEDAREDFEAVVSLAPKRSFLSFHHHCFLHVLTHP